MSIANQTNNYFSKILINSFNFVKKLAFRISSNMDEGELMPPSRVRNMKTLDRSAFSKEIRVPSLIVKTDDLADILKKCKKHLLKIMKLNPIILLENEETRQILLNPVSVKSEQDLHVIGMDLKKTKFEFTTVTVGYDNWKPEQIFRSVLPQDSENCSSYSIIGHILHLNLREHLHSYKYLIGQVYLDKIPNASLVVNKSDIIDNSDNTFRSFSMQKLAGNTDDTIVTVKANNSIYKFDFAKVYWNPRLSTEHLRVVNKFKPGDILFDVMAGVGPFSIPAAKKYCQVYANDLNPLSFQALEENCKLNKVADRIQCYNMDGKDFIKDVFRQKLLEMNDFNDSIHVTMNLPSIAVEFLKLFSNIFTKENIPKILQLESTTPKLPLIHLYLFSYDEREETAIHSVASRLGLCCQHFEIDHIHSANKEELKNNIKSEFLDLVSEVVYVRKVAPAKVMFRVSFYLPPSVMIYEETIESQPLKKVKF